MTLFIFVCSTVAEANEQIVSCGGRQRRFLFPLLKSSVFLIKISEMNKRAEDVTQEYLCFLCPNKMDVSFN